MSGRQNDIHAIAVEHLVDRLLHVGMVEINPHAGRYGLLPSWSFQRRHRQFVSAGEGLMPRDLVARFAGTAHVSVKVFGTGARERHSSIYRSVGYAALSGHRYLQVIVGLHEGHAARWMGWLSAVQPPGINLANASGIRTSQELVRAIAAVRGVPTRADDRLPIRVPDRLLHRWQQDPEAGQ